MADLIDDDMLDAFAVVGELDDIAGEVLDVSADSSTGSASTPPTAWSPSVWAEVLAGFRGLSRGRPVRDRRCGPIRRRC